MWTGPWGKKGGLSKLSSKTKKKSLGFKNSVFISSVIDNLGFQTKGEGPKT